MRFAHLFIAAALRHFVSTLIAVAAATLSAPTAAADLSGHWRYFQRDAIAILPHTYDHAADFVLWQRGDRVYGTWSESGHRGSQGCVQGVVKSRSLHAQMCLEDGSFGSESGAICPVFAPAKDRFDLSGKSLVWHRYNDHTRKWEKYVTLTKRNSISKGSWPKECGQQSAQAESAAPVSSRPPP